MDIKALMKYKFYIGVTVVLVMIALVFVALGVINNLSVRESYTNIVAKKPTRKSDSTTASNTVESQKSTLIPERNINEAINFLDMLDYSEDLTFGIYKKTTPKNTPNKTVTTRDEQLLQRYYRIRDTSEYKMLEKRYNQLIAELYQLAFLDMLREQLMAYEQNPFSVFGLTKEEGNQREWTDSDLQYIQSFGENLEQQIREYEDFAKAIEDEKDRLQEKRLELLGMTEEEYSLVLKLDQVRRQTS